MPRQARFSKDDIVAAGLRIVRSSGFEAISARALGKELGTSSSPMFTMFKDMNEVKSSLMLVKNELQDNLSFKQCIALFSERDLRAFGNFLLHKEKF